MNPRPNNWPAELRLDRVDDAYAVVHIGTGETIATIRRDNPRGWTVAAGSSKGRERTVRDALWLVAGSWRRQKSPRKPARGVKPRLPLYR